MSLLDWHSRFVGRARELAVVAAHLEAAARGRTSIVLVAGEPGIGKTRLVEQAIAGATASDGRVVWSRGHEGEPGAAGPVGVPAFWPWAQVLRALVTQRAAVAPRAEQILPEQLASVAQLLPELRTLRPDLPPPPALAPEQARLYLFDAVVAVLAQAARAGERPLVLVLDDLQWADAASLQLLEFVAAGTTDLPLLVVGTYRDADARPGRPLQRLLGALVRRSHVANLTLRPLGPEEVQAVVEGALGTAPPAALVAALVQQTDGNPLYLTETLRLLADEGRLTGAGNFSRTETFGVPPGLRAVIARRLDRLSPACQRALTLAAIVGREFDLGVLESAGETAGTALLDALEEAEEARIIAGAPGIPGRFRFTHALIGQTLADGLSTIRGMRLHGEIAGALARRWGEDPEHLGVIAHHFLLAAPGMDAAPAVAYARRAAEHARAVLAFEDAARFCEMALQALALCDAGAEAERCEILLMLGEAQNRAGDIGAAKRTFREAAAAAHRLGSPRDLARAALGYGGDGFAPRLLDDTLPALLDDALAGLGGVDAALRARLLARRSQTLYWSDERERQAALSHEAVALARGCGDAAATAYALAARCVTLRAPEQTAELVTTASELIELAERAGDPEMRFWGHRWRLRGLLELGDIAAVDADFDALVGLSEELRQPYQRWYVTMLGATRALLAGAFDETERLVRDAWELGTRVQKDEAEPYYVVQLCCLRWAQGRPGEVEAPLADAVSRGVPAWRSLRALIWSDEPAMRAAARAEIDRVAARDTPALPYGLPRDGNWLVALARLADACAALGDAGHAARLYDLLLPFEARNAVSASSGPCHGPVARPLGRLAAVLGRRAAAAAHFEKALRMSATLGADPWVARTSQDYAAMLLDHAGSASDRPEARHEDRSRALTLLDDALALGERLGMAALVRQVTDLREQARGAAAEPVSAPAARLAAVPTADPPSNAPAAGFPAGLTVREVEVLRLLAAGLSNPEIAERLVVSRKTVQQHTVNIYRKIRARGRTDAAAYAYRHGLAPTLTELP